MSQVPLLLTCHLTSNSKVPAEHADADDESEDNIRKKIVDLQNLLSKKKAEKADIDYHPDL